VKRTQRPICPIMSYRDAPKSHPRECLREQCAWWDDELKQCVIHSIFDQMIGIEEAILRTGREE